MLRWKLCKQIDLITGKWFCIDNKWGGRIFYRKVLHVKWYHYVNDRKSVNI